MINIESTTRFIVQANHAPSKDLTELLQRAKAAG